MCYTQPTNHQKDKNVYNVCANKMYNIYAGTFANLVVCAHSKYCTRDIFMYIIEDKNIEQACSIYYISMYIYGRFCDQ